MKLTYLQTAYDVPEVVVIGRRTVFIAFAHGPYAPSMSSAAVPRRKILRFIAWPM